MASISEASKDNDGGEIRRIAEDGIRLIAGGLNSALRESEIESDTESVDTDSDMDREVEKEDADVDENERDKSGFLLNVRVADDSALRFIARGFVEADEGDGGDDEEPPEDMLRLLLGRDFGRFPYKK